MSLALQMEQLEMQRRHHNNELGYKYAALNQGSGYLGGGAPGGGYSAGGGSMFRQGWGSAPQSPSTFTPTTQPKTNTPDSWGGGLTFNKLQ
jgi:hypothetical protein